MDEVRSEGSFEETQTWECDGCGVCCRTYAIFATERDARREPRIAFEGRRLPLHLADGPWTYRLFPLPFLESCPFLDGMDRCEIYEDRPQVCRELQAGDSQCQEARKKWGLPPLEPVVRKPGEKPVPPGSRDGK